MNRKLNILRFVILLLAVTLAFTGCEQILEMLGFGETSGDPDLTVLSVEPLKSGEELTGIRIVFANLGESDASFVTYAVVFSTDATISIATDYVIYEGNLSLGAGKNSQVDLAGSDIDPWIASHNVQVPDGKYFLGAFIDPDDTVIEENELNNEGASNISFDFGQTGGTTATEGTLTIDLVGADDLNGKTLIYGVYPLGADPEALPDPMIAIGRGQILNGFTSALAELALGGTWMGSIGTSYDIYLMIDMDGGDIDWTEGVDLDYSNHPLTVAINSEDTVSQIDRSSFFVNGPNTLTLRLEQATFATGYEFTYLITAAGADPSTAVHLAGAMSTVDGSGIAEAVAIDETTSAAWEGDSGTTYDVWVFLDLQGDAAPGVGEYTFNSWPYAVTMDGPQSFTLYGSEFDQVPPSLTVELDSANMVAGSDIIYQVFDAGADRLTDQILAEGFGVVQSDGSASIAAMAYLDNTMVWEGTAGQDYDLYVLIDTDYSGDGTEGDYGEFLTITRSAGDDVFLVNFADMGFINGTLSIDIYNAAGLAGEVFTFGVYDVGGTPGTDPPLARGAGPILADGTANVLAVHAETGWAWNSNDGEQFDVYMMVDLDGDSLPGPGEYSHFATIDRVGGLSQVSLDLPSDFALEAHPAVFGVYSDDVNHPVVVAPEWYGQDVALDLAYPGPIGITPYDGSPVLEAVFTDMAVTKIRINYPTDPAVMDISASTSFVFAIDDNFAIPDGLASFTVLLAWATGYEEVTVSIGIAGTYNTAMDVGPDGNWDTYSIPLTDFPNLDKAQLVQIEISNTKDAAGAQLACSIYFDDIHFE